MREHDGGQIDENTDYETFKYSFEITDGLVRFFTEHNGVKCETDLKFSLQEIENYLELKYSEYPNELEDAVGDEIFDLENYLCVCYDQD